MPISRISYAGDTFDIHRPPNPAVAIASIEFPKGSSDQGHSITIPGTPSGDFIDAPVGLINLYYEDIVNGVHFCNFQLEDLDGSLEKIILRNRDKILVRFGYSSHMQELSNKKVFRISSFNSTFTGSTVTLNMKCIGLKASKILFSSKSEAHVGKTASQVFTDIVQSTNSEGTSWGDGKVEPSVPLPERTSSGSGNPEQVLNRNKITNMKYIQDVLIPATSASRDGRNAYVMYINEDEGATGADNYYFGPRDYEEAPKRIYFNRGPDASIVKWAPVIASDVQLYMGAGNIKVAKVDPYSEDREEQKDYDFNVNEVTVNPKQTLGGSSTQSSINVTRTIQSAFTTKGKLKAVADWAWNEIRAFSFQASLVILGDPTIRANSIIHVVIARPDGTIHFTSGPWWINTIKHTIAHGEYTCELQLLRTHMPDSAKIKGHVKQ